MSIYCISIYDGKKSKSFYITDYKSLEDLMSELFKTLLTRAYSQRTVFIQNSSEFDLIFLLKHIVNLEGVSVDPIIKDGKFINLKIKYGPKNTYYLNFKDSFLLLPVSLSKLAKQFQVETLKSIFPHKYVSKDTLNYVGSLPSLIHFTNTSEEDYQTYSQKFVNNNWNLKSEAIKYCEIDCIALYQVIETFSKFIFDQFKVNVSSVSTLPSLAFKIFRTNLLDKYVTIPVLFGKVYNDISQAYYGGHVDMYIPTNPEGELVYQYDVNSLYPYSMKTYKYPTSILAYFKGNIEKMAEYNKMFKSSLAILKVRVVAPENIEHPILPYK
uniref:hypothetical protein n=1 Tax=Inonotus hispidus TaxID=40469 RepID=UPI0021822905|nr:hypothetical protein N4M07_mgp055 [Inonotus hispidus]UVF37997.1 hypothetical protein [Inonotus hispidus]